MLRKMRSSPKSKTDLNLRDLEELRGLLNFQTMQEIVDHFLNSPYKSNALPKEANISESIIFSLCEFDCLTFVETCLAIYLSNEADEFISKLKEIRYKEKVSFKDRNHYFSDWLNNNDKKRFIKLHKDGCTLLHKALNILKEFPSKNSIIYAHKISSEFFSKLKSESYIIAFVSDKIGLDFFHVGILIKEDQIAEGLSTLYHASRSKALVVKEDIYSFIKKNNVKYVCIAKISPV